MKLAQVNHRVSRVAASRKENGGRKDNKVNKASESTKASENTKASESTKASMPALASMGSKTVNIKVVTSHRSLARGRPSVAG